MFELARHFLELLLIHIKIEPLCGRDPERSRRGQPAGEILSAQREGSLASLAGYFFQLLLVDIKIRIHVLYVVMIFDGFE